MEQKPEIVEIEKVKEKIIFTGLLWGTILGSIAFLVSLNNLFDVASRIGDIIDLLALLVFISTLLFWKKQSLKRKTTFTIIGILILVFNDLYRFGVFSDNIVLLVLIVLFSVLGLNLKNTITLFFISVFFYLTIAFLYLNGTITTETSYSIRALSPNVWVVKIVLIGAVALITLIFISRLIDNYNKLIIQLKNNNDEIIQAKHFAEESEIQFRNLFENAADAIFVAEVETGILIDANYAAERLLQKPKNEIIGLHQSKLHPPKVEEYSVEAFRRQQKEDEKLEHIHLIENTVLCSDGTEVPVEVLGFNTVFKGKKCMVGTFRNISERKNAALQLQLTKEEAEENSANVTAIIEGTTESIWAFNRKYEILYINHVFQQEFFQSFGVKLEKGVSLIQSLPELLRPVWKPRYDRVLNNEQFRIEDAVDTEIGIIYIEIMFNPIIKDGRVIGGSCMGSNITGRKMAELELIKAKESAEESDRLKSAFLANMSHEIRTPMNGILGFADLLKEPELAGEQQKKFIDMIDKSGQRMLNIINDIIDISKIEAGSMEINITESNINDQIEYIYTFFKPEAERKGLQFSLNANLSGKEAMINTDREKLYAVLTNLVKNAIKYTIGGRVELACYKRGNNLEIYVKDTGVGIPSDRQKAIFERFVQADISDKMAREGAGLGLSISKAFVEMLGGKIWVESKVGKGSTFYFTLPYKNMKNDNSKNETINAANKNDDDVISQVSGKIILIAEDDKISDTLLTRLVKKFSTKIIKTSTGTETVEACQNHPEIDLILMDIKMPGMDGYMATEQIRAFNKKVIIIAQTAYGLEGDREKALKAGCDDYITKPISKDKLESLILKYFN